MTNNTSLPKIIVIVGPTATNKTKLAVDIAKHFGGEIINADAFQVYKELNIGVNKPTVEEMKSAKFHLVDNISINEPWDIKIFQDEAKKIIAKLDKENKLPIVVGGSHLYIDALIKNYALNDIIERTDQFEQFTNPQLFEMVSNENKELAKKIGINNRRRLVRALQLMKDVDDKEKALEQTNAPIYDFLMISTTMPDREQLYGRINRRVDQMLKDGWTQEVLAIYQNDRTCLNKNAFKAIGYREVANAILRDEEIKKDIIKQNTRNYAKRQMTWIRAKYKNALSFDQKNTKELISKIEKWLE